MALSGETRARIAGAFVGRSIANTIGWAARTTSGVTGSLATGAARRLGGLFTETLFNPLTRLCDYSANMIAPVVFPPTSELIELYYSRRITLQQLVYLTSGYGVNLSSQPTALPPEVLRKLPSDLARNAREAMEAQHAAWAGVLANNRPYYPIDFVRKLTRQGVLTDDKLLREALTKEGFSTKRVQDLFVNEYEPIGVTTIIQLYRRKILSRDQLLQLMLVLGYRTEQVDQQLSAADEIPDVGMAVQLWRYGYYTEQGARDAILATGWPDSGPIDYIMAGRFQEPSLADVLAYSRMTVAGAGIQRWIVNNTATPDVYSHWAKRLGYTGQVDWPEGQAQHEDASGWANWQWQAQWAIPSVSQLAEMVWRFSQDTPNPTGSGPNIPAITQADIDAILTANGVADGFKPYVQALFYKPLSIRHINLIAAQTGATPQQISGYLQQTGIQPAIANMLGQAYWQQAEQKRMAPLLAQRKAAVVRLQRAVESAYRIGTLDAPTASTELIANGVDPAAAQVTLAAIDVEANNQITAAVVSRTKSEIFAGLITVQQGVARLTQAGLAGPRVAELGALWSAKLSPKVRTLATGQITKLLRDGLLTRQQALLRLENLGWTNPDALLLLKDIQLQIAKDQAKAIAAVEAKTAKEEAETVKLLKQAEGYKNQLKSRLTEITPPATILKWYRQGIWSEGQARSRLSLLGYPDDIASDMLLSALTVLPKATQPATGAPP